MGLKETIKTMHSIIDRMVKDLKKSEKGNKAASQRARTGSIKLAKVAKSFRKESVIEEKKRKKKKAVKKPSKGKKSKVKRKKRR